MTTNDELFEKWWKEMKPAEVDELRSVFEECWIRSAHHTQSEEVTRLREDTERAVNALRLIKAMPHSHEAIRTCIQTLEAIDAARKGESA